MTSESARCPVCGSGQARAIHGPLRLCRPCRIAFNSSHIPAEYGDGYFVEDYRRQYGVTYIEDFPAIYALAGKRLGRILHLFNSGLDRSSLSLLDVGAAAGFFLKCALDNGIGNVHGVEISEYACMHARKEFGIQMEQASFHDYRIRDRYDVVTAWYFLEHCDDPLSVLRKIHGALRDRGIFAFSVPSLFGPQYCFRRDEWIATHPTDHRIDVTPRGIRGILNKCGFRTLQIVPGGIHPERMVSPRSWWYRPFALLYGAVSRVVCFSDTIEVYAVKSRDS